MSVTVIPTPGDPGEYQPAYESARSDLDRDGLSERDHQAIEAFADRLAGMTDVEVAVNWGYDSPAAIKDLRTVFNGSWR